MAEENEQEEIIWYTFFSERENREYYYEPRTQVATWILPEMAQLHPSRTRRTKPGATPKKQAPARRATDVKEAFAIPKVKNTNDGFLKVVTSTRFGFVYLVLNMVFITGLFIANDSRRKFPIGEVFSKFMRRETQSVSSPLGETIVEIAAVHPEKSAVGIESEETSVQQNALYEEDIAHRIPQQQMNELDDELTIPVDAISANAEDEKRSDEGQAVENVNSAIDSSSERTPTPADDEKLTNNSSGPFGAHHHQPLSEKDSNVDGENFIHWNSAETKHESSSSADLANGRDRLETTIEVKATKTELRVEGSEPWIANDDSNLSGTDDPEIAPVIQAAFSQTVSPNLDLSLDDRSADLHATFAVESNVDQSAVLETGEHTDDEDGADRDKSSMDDAWITNGSTLESAKQSQEVDTNKYLKYKDWSGSHNEDDNLDLQMSMKNTSEITSSENLTGAYIHIVSTEVERNYNGNESAVEKLESFLETNHTDPKDESPAHNTEVEVLDGREDTTIKYQEDARVSDINAEETSVRLADEVGGDVGCEQAPSLNSQRPIATNGEEEMTASISEPGRNILQDSQKADDHEGLESKFETATTEEASAHAADGVIHTKEIPDELEDVDSKLNVETETTDTEENEEVEKLMQYIEDVSFRSKTLVGSIVDKLESQISTSGHAVDSPHPKRYRFNPKLFFQRKLAFDALGERESENELICDNTLYSRFNPRCTGKRLTSK